MSIIEFIQKFFLFLLPGIVGALLYSQLSITREQHYYLELLKLICLSFASYLLSDVVFWALGGIPVIPWKPVNIIRLIGSPEGGIPVPNVAAALCVSVLLSCALVKLVDDGWFFAAANRLSLTHRTGNRPVWEQFMDNGHNVVLRDYVTRNIYYGRVEVFSDNSEQRELLLGDVTVFNEDAEFLYRAEYLYLSREHNQFSVEIQTDQSIHGEGDGADAVEQTEEGGFR